MLKTSLPTLVVIAALSLHGSLLTAQSSAADLRGQAIASFREGRMAEAEEALRSFLLQNPKDAGGLSFLAIVLDTEKKYSEADGYYAEALVLTPQSVPLRNNLGNHYAATGEEAKAREQFLAVVAVDPAHHNANLQLARLDVAQMKGSEALRYLAHLDTSTPGTALLRAEALHWAGHRKEAVAAMDALERSVGADPAELFAIGLSLAHIQRYERAEEVFAKVLQHRPGDFDALFNMGLAAAHAGHMDRAQETLEVVHKLRPDDGAVLSSLGRVYAAKQEYLLAVPLLADAHRRAPTDAPLLLALARALDGAGSVTEAVGAYDEYLALRPEDESARSDRALDYSVTGRRTEAIADLQRALDRSPKDAQGYFRMALVLEQNDARGAADLLTRALTLDPRFVSARYERGVLLHRFGKMEDALRDLETAAAAEPDNPAILAETGAIYLALHRPREAETVLRQALQAAPEDRAVLMHLGRALAEVGKERESALVLARLDELGPETRTADPTTGVSDQSSLTPAQRLNHYINSLERAAEGRPKDIALHFQLGDALLEAGRKEDAARVFLAIPDADPATGMQLAEALNRSSGPSAALEEMERAPRNVRGGSYWMLQAELLNDAGSTSEARTSMVQHLPSIAVTPALALRAAALELLWGDANAALPLAARAATLRSSSLLQAIALDKAGHTTQADVVIHQAQSRWPAWGAPFLIEGALLILRHNPQSAGQKLFVAHSLGESTAELTLCLDSAKDCNALARDALVAAISTTHTDLEKLAAK